MTQTLERHVQTDLTLDDRLAAMVAEAVAAARVAPSRVHAETEGLLSALRAYAEEAFEAEISEDEILEHAEARCSMASYVMSRPN